MERDQSERDRNKKVVWREGMALDPHHLQQWDRYHQNMVTERVRGVTRYAWGFTRVEFSEPQLANGQLSLLRCTGVMPDGLTFDLNDSDLSPLDLNLEDNFPRTEEALDVFLAVPMALQTGQNYGTVDEANRTQAPPRFVIEPDIDVLDETNGKTKRPIDLARPNFRLVSGESAGFYNRIQVARVRRGGEAFILDKEFVPPCLSLFASLHLVKMARLLHDRLDTRSNALTEEVETVFGDAHRPVMGVALKRIGLLQTVNTFIPLLKRHYHTSERRVEALSHPEALFTTMLALGGHLSVYGARPSVHPRIFPKYDHNNPGPCFAALNKMLHDMLLEEGTAPPFVRIRLERSTENRYTASIKAAAAVLDPKEYFLEVRGLPQEIVERVPKFVRLASPSNIDQLINYQLPGLQIEFVRGRLPANLPEDPLASYFLFVDQGEYWDAIQEDQALVVFLLETFPGMEFDIVAVTTPERR